MGTLASVDSPAQVPESEACSSLVDIIDSRAGLMDVHRILYGSHIKAPTKVGSMSFWPTKSIDRSSDVSCVFQICWAAV